MPNSEEEKEQDAAEDESEEQIEEEGLEEPGEEELEELEEEEEEEAEAPPRGAAWGFWRVLFALLIIVVVAVAGWLGWQYVAAQKEQARRIAEKEAETKTHVLLVIEKLRSATEGGTAGDMNVILDDLNSASEALRLALSVAPTEMRDPLDMLATKLASTRDDVEQRQQRLQAQAEKEAKAAAEAVSAVLTHAESIVRQEYSGELDVGPG